MPLGDYVTDPVRRNVMLLALCQALFMSVQAMSIATTPLAGHMLLGSDKSLATLPIFLTHAGIMLATIPASLLMERLGRRTGFSLGALFGVGSGVVSTLAIYQGSFKLLCVGAMLQGFAAGFAWYYRFAAADSAEPAFRAKAISLVMAGGVIAGFIGPQGQSQRTSGSRRSRLPASMSWSRYFRLASCSSCRRCAFRCCRRLIGRAAGVPCRS